MSARAIEIHGNEMSGERRAESEPVNKERVPSSEFLLPINIGRCLRQRVINKLQSKLKTYLLQYIPEIEFTLVVIS